MTSIGSTVVENLTSDPKFEGSNLDIGTGREKMAKIYTKMASASSTVVDHTKSDSNFEGSNPACTGRERERVEKYLITLPAFVAHW